MPEVSAVEPSTETQSGLSLYLHPGPIVFILGLLIKGALVWTFPALYGGDTVLHLRNHGHILLAHQLPMLQILIYLVHGVSSQPMAFRFVMVLIGALSGVGFYRLCLALSSPRAAFWAALFFVTNPFLNELSIVPFQEMLMLGALCSAFDFYIKKRMILAALCLGIACLTRYEAWIACPILLYDYVADRRFSLSGLAKALLLFTSVPAAWIAWHLNFSAPGTYVIEAPTTASRLVRWAYLGWICVKQTPFPVLLLAAVGVSSVYKLVRSRSRGAILAATFLLLFLVAVLFSAHGDPHPDNPNPELFVTSREATLLIGCILVLSAFGMARFPGSSRWHTAFNWIGGAGLALGLLQSAHFIASEVSRPDVELSYVTAKFLENQVAPTEKVLILAKSFSEKDWDLYLKKSRQLLGESGYGIARKRLEVADLSPMNFQRTAVQANLPESALLWSADPRDVNWIVIWSDSTPPESLTASLRAFSKIARFTSNHLEVAVWRRSSAGGA